MMDAEIDLIDTHEHSVGKHFFGYTSLIPLEYYLRTD